MSIDLSALLTERRNANSANIDTLSTVQMLTVINQKTSRWPTRSPLFTANRSGRR